MSMPNEDGNSSQLQVDQIVSNLFSDLLDSIIVDVASECHRITRLGLDQNLEEEEEEQRLSMPSNPEETQQEEEIPLPDLSIDGGATVVPLPPSFDSGVVVAGGDCHQIARLGLQKNLEQLEEEEVEQRLSMPSNPEETQEEEEVPLPGLSVDGGATIVPLPPSFNSGVVVAGGISRLDIHFMRIPADTDIFAHIAEAFRYCFEHMYIINAYGSIIRSVRDHESELGQLSLVEADHLEVISMNGVYRMFVYGGSYIEGDVRMEYISGDSSHRVCSIDIFRDSMYSTGDFEVILGVPLETSRAEFAWDH